MTTFVRACLVCAFVSFGVLSCDSQLYAQALPAPWTNADIGAPPAAGSASESGGTFSVRGAGTDIWYSSDQFHFVYQPITGDADVRAQVAGVEYIHEWTKAGVMIRASLDARASHASTFVTPAKGLVFQRRVFTAGASTSTSGALATAPYWVRIVRSGQLFTSYVSTDGSSWMLVGSETISMPATAYVGLAVVSKDPDRTALATFTGVSVGASSSTEPPPPAPAPPPSPAPSAWVDGDIGNPAVAGRASESGGTFSVTGAGSDIWNTADQFHFMYRHVDGDLEIVARVLDIERANDWSKAGVMIRQDLTASSAHALMAGTPAKGWAFQRRPVAGSLTVHSPGSFTTPPGWVRLVRSGNTFSAYESPDGSTWTLVGTETIDMPAGVYVGLAVTSHNTSATSTATFTNVTITTAPSTNQPPTVTMTAPASGTTYTAPATIALSANASDADGTVAQVEFFANGQSVGIDTASPYEATWNNVTEGSYSLTAVATDDSGATTTSNAASVTVAPAPNQPPTVSITSPANGATYTAPATVTITANATDGDGTVARVDFFRGTQLIASDATAPYSATWSGAAAGTYALTAVAFDDDNASTSSAAVNVVVNAPPNQPPAVSITSPANGATYTAPATITITANATDGDGTVASVEFFANGQSIGTDTSSPYALTWSNVSAGTYSLTAVARDNANASTTSAAVAITVNAAPPPPAGTIAFVQQAGREAGTSTSATLAFPAPNTSGNFIAVAIRASGLDQVFSVTDTSGNQYRKASQFNVTRDGVSLAIFYAENIAAGTNTVTVSDSAPGTLRFAILEYAGVAASASLDVTTQAEGSGTAVSSGAVTTTTDGALVLGVVMAATPVGVTAGAGYTLRSTVPANPNVKLAVEDLVQPGAGAVSATATLAANDVWGAIVATFRSGNAPQQPPPAPASPNPSNAATTVALNSTLSWNGSTGSTFDVRFGTSSTPQVVASNLTSATYNPGPLSASTTYFWQVIARNASGTTTGPVWSFTTAASPPPPPTPTSVAFNPSPDHDTLVTSYTVAIYRASDPVTATPVATKDLGKPAPSNGDIVVDISDIVNPLAAGSYYAVVSAVGAGGSSGSSPSANFTK